MPPDTSFLVNGFRPTVAAADPRDVIAFKQNQAAGAQQLQEGAIGLQEKQRDLKDQQILSDAMQASGGDAQKGLMIGVKNGLSPKAFFATQQSMLKNAGTVAETNKNNAQAESDWYSAQEKSNKMVSGTTGALLNLPPSQRAAAYPAAMQKLAKDLKVDPSTLPQDYESFGGDAALVQLHDQHLDNAEQIAVQKAAYEKKAADQKLVADKAEEDRKAALAPAILGKANNEKITTTPNQAGLTPEQATKAEQERLNAINTEKDRAITQGQGAARIGIERTKDAREQQIYDQTYGPNADQQLVGVEPKARSAARAAAQKAADEHGKATAAEADMKTFLDLAKSGNKEAHAYLSPEGVLTLNTGRGVTRVNRQEIEAYAGAGSLFDNIASHVGKWTSGQSIPSDVLKDIEDLHAKVSSNADVTYNSKLDSINQNYHANFKPVPSRGTTVPTLPPEAKAQLKEGFNTKFGNGQVWTLKNGVETQVK